MKDYEEFDCSKTVKEVLEREFAYSEQALADTAKAAWESLCAATDLMDRSLNTLLSVSETRARIYSMRTGKDLELCSSPDGRTYFLEDTNKYNERISKAIHKVKDILRKEIGVK